MNHIIFDRSNSNFILKYDNNYIATSKKNKEFVEFNKGLVGRLNALQNDLRMNHPTDPCRLEYTINSQKLNVYPFCEIEGQPEQNVMNFNTNNKKITCWSKNNNNESLIYTIKRKIMQFRPKDGNMKVFYTTLHNENFIIGLATNSYKKLIMSVDNLSSDGHFGSLTNTQNNVPVYISEMWPELEIMSYNKFDNTVELITQNNLLDTVNNDMNISNSIIQLYSHYNENNHNITIDKLYCNKNSV